jgi:hypothetical protein
VQAQQQQQSQQDQAVAALAAAAQGLALRPAAVGLPPAGTHSSSSSSRGSVDEVSVAVELLLPACSVQQLLAAKQESVRAVVLSCAPGRLLGNLVLDKAWQLPHDDDGDSDDSAADSAAAPAAAAGSDAADDVCGEGCALGVMAAAAGYEQSGAKSLQLQLRIIREKPQQGSTGGTHGPTAAAAAAAAGTAAINVDGVDGQLGSPSSCLSECQVLSVVLMTAPAAAEGARDHAQSHTKAAADPAAAAVAAAEDSDPGEGDVMLAQLPLLVLPAAAQAELQQLFGTAEAAGVPYATMYWQLLPLLQDWELLLTLCGSSSSDSSDGGVGDDADGRDGGGCAEAGVASDGDDGKTAATASGGVSFDGRGGSDGRREDGRVRKNSRGKAAQGDQGGIGGSSDGNISGWGSADGGSDGSAIDTGQLKAAAAALAAYFVAHGMPQCLKLVAAIKQQLRM